jgi:drug/metabolite transporter (DMT)-like permease
MVAAYVVLCLIWGTTWSAIQIGLRGIPPLTGVALRFAIAGVLLLLFARVRGIGLGATARERWLWVCNGLFAFCISYGVVYWSEQWVPSGLASVLFATYPLFVAMLAHVMLPDERVSRRELIGIAVGFGGVAVIFSADFAALGGRQVAVAAAVMLVSPAAAAVSSVVVKRWGAGVHPLSLTAVPMTFTGMVMGALAVAYEGDRTFRPDVVSVSALLYLAIAGSAVTFTLYYWLLSYLPAKRLALIAYIIPVIAMLIGTLRGEPLTARTLGGSALVLAGVALAIHRQSMNRYSR